MPHWFGLDGASPEPGEPRRGRPDDFGTVVRDQLRCMNSVDEGVGTILETLADRGLLDNTVVVFTSDQGYLHGEFGIVREKRWPYDPVLRIPFLMRYPPRIPAGMIIDQMTLNVDLCPTVLAFANVDHYEPFHGRSLLPLLDPRDDAGTAAVTNWRSACLFEYFVEQVGPRFPRYFAVRTAGWKYVHYPQLSGMDELYSLKDDPGEGVNLADDPRYGVQLGQMQSELRRLNRDTANPFPMAF